MQRANCFVRLNGDLGTNITKYGITPPEAVVLRRLHGPDAVNQLTLVSGNDKTPHAEVMEELLKQYTARNKDSNVPVVLELFPGINPRLPTTFAEVGFQVAGDEPKAQRQAQSAGDDTVLSVAELKAELDARGITYKGNASKAALAKLLQDAIDAGDATAGGGDWSGDQNGNVDPETPEDQQDDDQE